jgi:hypothetical protein
MSASPSRQHASAPADRRTGGATKIVPTRPSLPRGCWTPHTITFNDGITASAESWELRFTRNSKEQPCLHLKRTDLRLAGVMLEFEKPPNDFTSRGNRLFTVSLDAGKSHVIFTFSNGEFGTHRAFLHVTNPSLSKFLRLPAA